MNKPDEVLISKKKFDQGGGLPAKKKRGSRERDESFPSGAGAAIKRGRETKREVPTRQVL